MADPDPAARDPADLDDAVIVALGSNLPGPFGSSEALLEAAVARLPSVGLNILKRSCWWRSTAWPDPSGPEYRNGVVLVEAAGLDAPAVLDRLLRIEAQLGRRRAEPNAPRTLDLDLIAYGRAVMDTADLTLPHPRAHQRLFVMGPLAEIAPDWAHPVLGLTPAALAQAATVGTDARPVGSFHGSGP